MEVMLRKGDVHTQMHTSGVTLVCPLHAEFQMNSEFHKDTWYTDAPDGISFELLGGAQFWVWRPMAQTDKKHLC